MAKQRFSEENNEEQQRQALQEGHILKDKRASPETEQLSAEWSSLFLLPDTVLYLEHGVLGSPSQSLLFTILIVRIHNQ